MTEQRYRIVADRDKGDDPQAEDVREGDLYTSEAHGGFPMDDPIVRIERPVPTTGMTAMSHESTGFCFCGQMHGQVKDWNEYDWAALRTHQPTPSVPTREQIAALPDDARMDAYYYGFERTGVGFIDAILSAVAIAGKGAHHTESWGDPWEGTEYYYRGRPGLPDADNAVDLIQKAAQQAADAVLALIQKGTNR